MSWRNNTVSGTSRDITDSQVVCPRDGHLCFNGYTANGDSCYSRCATYAEEVKHAKAVDAAARSADRDNWNYKVQQRREDFKSSLKSWGANSPCPRCAAAVPTGQKELHAKWHWDNDKELQYA